MSKVIISDGNLKSIISPDYGAAVLALFFLKDNREIAIMPDATRETCKLDASSFLMIPYSNRIENGKFAFEGKNYHLRDGNKHSIHGDTRKRKWNYEKVSDSKVICIFDSKEHDNVNWPWPFSAEAEYFISDNTFTSKISLRNEGSTPMPAGFGWHPYYNRSLTKNNEAVHIQFKTNGVYPDTNGNCIPSGHSLPSSKKLDFSKEKQLDPKVHIDNCYEGYDGKGYILWPESKIKASYNCSPECSHVIFFNPDETFFAFEPATNANNGVNHMKDEGFNSGTVVLKPGETLTATFAVKVENI